MGWSHILWFIPALRNILLDTCRQSSTVIYWLALVSKSHIYLFLFYSITLCFSSSLLYPTGMSLCTKCGVSRYFWGTLLCELLRVVEGYGSPVRQLCTSKVCHPQSLNRYLSSSAWYSSDRAGTRFWSPLHLQRALLMQH